ncbi:unnamed protein product [Linum trigynum]|uniref:Uncharacterized protein n=1 Tax=Linum trigynum TaxID=586398 RepID=A0AAV2E5E6_9ROSI
MRPSFASVLALLIFFILVSQPRFARSRALLIFHDHANNEVPAAAGYSASATTTTATATNSVARASETVKDPDGRGGGDQDPATAVVNSNLASGPSRKGEGH